MEYSKLAPNLIDTLTEEEIIQKAREEKPVRVPVEKKPTVSKKNEMVKYFKWYGSQFVPSSVDDKYHGKGIRQIAKECGLEPEFVKKCLSQYRAAISEVKSSDTSGKDPFVDLPPPKEDPVVVPNDGGEVVVGK